MKGSIHMGKKGVSLPKHAAEDLAQEPHMMGRLIEMVTGKQQLAAVEQEQRWLHLSRCLPCQTFLVTYLLEVIASDKASGRSVASAQKMLSKLQRLMHETLKEDIPAYVEMLEERGEKNAKVRYSWLAEHIPMCEECAASVQELRAWLREAALEGWV
jgi:hypothetical protein